MVDKNFKPSKKMVLEEYQALAEATMNPELDRRGRLCNCALGLCEESFELHELLFELNTENIEPFFVIRGSPLDSSIKLDVVDEAGDVMWYTAVLADALGESLNDICAPLFEELPYDHVHTIVEPDRCTVRMEMAWHHLYSFSAVVAGLIKKHVYHDHPMDDKKLGFTRSRLMKIVGCVREIAGLNLVCLSEVLEYNIHKLRKRYPDGKFSAEASINRTI